MRCPTCKQHMNDAPRAGWCGFDCPQCGQGLNGAVHVAGILRRLVKAKAAPAGRVLARKVRADKAEAEVERLRQAVGLMTTAKPGMEMRADDPIGMALEVVAEVERLTRALDLQLSRAWRLERICGRVDMLILRLTASELATDTASLVGEIREARAALGEVPAVD